MKNIGWSGLTAMEQAMLLHLNKIKKKVLTNKRGKMIN